MPSRSTSKWAAFVALGCCAVSCADAESQSDPAGTGGAAIGNGGAAVGATTGTAGAAFGTTTGTGGTTDEGGTSGPIGDSSTLISIDAPPVGSVGGPSDDACASESCAAKKLPLDMYIMLDSSDSMRLLLADNRTTKWDAVRKALTTFVSDMASSGLGVGLQYFPITQPVVANTCFSDPACAQSEPCDLPTTCLGGATVKPCKTAADCGGQQCVALGVCRRSGGTRAPGGALRNMGGGALSRGAGACPSRGSCVTEAHTSQAVRTP